MDAAIPLTRSFSAASLLLMALGCTAPVYRGQAPQREPLPPPPINGVAPTATAPAVQGEPIVDSKVVPSGYTPSSSGMIKPVVDVPQGTPAIRVIAVVGGTSVVTDQEVWEAVRQRMQEYVSLVDGPKGKEIIRDDAKEKKLYYEELRRIIERELILDEMYARLRKAKKTEVMDDIKKAAAAQTNRQLNVIKKAYKVKTDEEFNGILAPQGLTLPVIRRQLERQMMAEEYVRSGIKDKIKGIGISQIHQYYDEHPDEFKTEDRVKWLDIFVSFNRFPNPRAAYDHAISVQQKAANGGDFLALVKEFDQGVAVHQNGEGIGSKHGEIRPLEVESAVWALKPDQVSGLIQTPTGYHIVKIAERDVAGLKPFDKDVQDEVRNILVRQLMTVEYKKIVEKLWRSGVVKLMIDVP